MLIAEAILEGRLDYSRELSDRLFTCFMCGACEVQCEKAAKIGISQITKAMRRDTINAGLQPERLNQITRALSENHQIYENSQWKGAGSMSSNAKINEKADLLYFAGCVISNRYPEIGRNTLRILNSSNIDVTILGKNEWCCGNPALSMGKTSLAKEIIMHNVETIKRKGAKIVLTSCAGCHRTMSKDYQKFLNEELPFKVLHVTELLDRLIQEELIKFRNSNFKRVTYHDPCELGRQCKIYESPRRIIQSIPNLDLVEMVRNRDNAWCCGGGGNVAAVHPTKALKVAELRMREAQESGAETLVTSCPSCIQMLELASKRMKTGIKVIDISELVSDAMETSAHERN